MSKQKYKRLNLALDTELHKVISFNARVTLQRSTTRRTQSPSRQTKDQKPKEPLLLRLIQKHSSGKDELYAR